MLAGQQIMGAHEADAVVAVTRDDPTNLAICVLAKQRFDVRWTVARMNDPSDRWLFTPPGGVDELRQRASDQPGGSSAR